MGNRKLGGILAVLVLTIGTGFAAAPARALSPPLAPKASIVFSNGKRLIRIKADATDREVLTLKKSYVSSTEGLHDTALAGSPDGKSVLLLRDDWSDKPVGPQGLMSLALDGGKPKMLVPAGRRTWISAAEYSDDGSLIYFATTRYASDWESVTLTVKSIHSDGSGGETLWTAAGIDRENSDEYSIGGIAPAPDGRLLLTFDFDTSDSHLDLLDPETGELTPLKAGAAWGSYSPDGSRIAFINMKQGYGSLNVMEADGSGAVRIAPKEPWYADRQPDWSADGTRIVFESDRGGKNGAYSEEIWSVQPDGDCLTRLTNGAPESTGPVWLGAAGDFFEPGACGDRAPDPVVETSIPERVLELEPHRFWMGPVWNGMLYDSLIRIMNGVSFDYGDCAEFESSACPGFRSIGTDEVCSLPFFPENYAGMRKVRGALIVKQNRDYRNEATVYTGGLSVDIQINDAKSFSEFVEAARLIQPVAGPALDRLDGPVFTLDDVKTAKMVRETRRREGSFASLKKLRIGKREASGYLRFARDLDRVGRYGTTRCRDFSNLP
ncbi:MAG: PD40 domain-containing protein [Solirubrobacterales bacterium]|nr:PD40 domain-containing protein [Solirubrobacterales bacterium]